MFSASLTYLSLQVPPSSLLQIEEEVERVKGSTMPKKELEKRFLGLPGVNESKYIFIHNYLHHLGVAMHINFSAGIAISM